MESNKRKIEETREICKAAARNIENRRKHRKLTRNRSKMKGTYKKQRKQMKHQKQTKTPNHKQKTSKINITPIFYRCSSPAKRVAICS